MEVKMKTLFFVLSLVLLLTVSSANAQSSENGWTMKSIKNLSAGINSDNYGLKRSAIYLAGKYKLDRLLDDLIKILDAERNEQVKILTAIAIDKIGDRKGLEAIRNKISSEKDDKVKQIYQAISAEYDL